MVGKICADVGDLVHYLDLDRSLVRPSDMGGLVLEIGGYRTVTSVFNPYHIAGGVFGIENEPDTFGVGAPSMLFSGQNRIGLVWSMNNPGFGWRAKLIDVE